jgi:hypothetical protein
MQVPVTNTANDWMVCCVTWRQSTAGSNASVSVGDDTSNYWFPLGIPHGTSSAAGVTRSAIWVAPAAFAAAFVTVSPSGPVTAMAANVYDVAGMSKYFTLAGIAVGNTTGTSITETLSAPASQAIVFTTAGADTHTATIGLASGGWGTVTRQVTTNGLDVLSDLTVASAFQVTSGSTTGHWTSTSSVDMSTAISGILAVTAAPTQVNPNWPVTVVEIAPSAGATTNVDQLTWVPITGQTMSLDVTQGRQYQLAALTTGSGTADIDNVTGSLIPPGTGSFAGIDSGCPFRVRMIWPASTNPYMVPFSGYIQKWPQQWDPDTQRGITTVQLVDAWNYVNGNLQPILIQEILNDQPLYYWPLTDSPTAGQASNLATGQAAPLFVTRSKFGAGTATEGFGQNSSALLGAQGTLLLTSSVREQAQSGMWGQTLTTATNTTQGYSLTINTGSFPFITNGLTIEWWFQVVAPFQTSGFFARVCDVSNINGSGWNVFLDKPTGSGGTGNLFFDASGPNSSGNLITMSAVNYQQAGSPITHCAVTFTRTTYILYVNGAVTAFGNFTTQLNRRITTISFNGLAGTPDEALLGNFSESFYSGYTAHAAIFNGSLAPGRIATHYQAGVSAMTGDTAPDRIERLMQGGGYLGPRVILADTGDAITTMASCQDVSGQPAAGSITNIVQSTAPSVLAVMSTGEVLYRAKQYAYNQPVTWVLGDKPTLGELPYSPQDFLVDYDPTRIINDVQLTQLDNQDIVLPAASINSAASQAQYGDCTYWATGYCQGDLTSPLTFGPGLLDLANWIGASNLKPSLRPASVTVDAATFPVAWPFVGQVQPGDIVTVNRRPPTVKGLVLTFTGRVSQVARSITAGTGGSTATATVIIDPVPELFALTADDSVRGQLNGTNVLAWG